MNLIILPVVVGLRMTKNCITSLLAQDIGNVRLLIIDNGSTDGVGSYLRTLPRDQVTLISYAHRRPLNKVWNECLRLAFDSLKLEYVLVVNNDVELMPEAYRLLRDDGGDFVTGVGTAPDQPLSIGDLSQKRPHPDFSCFLIRGKVWEKVGGFDETIHAYTGDSDYHLRMEAAGIRAESIQVPFTHIASGTIKYASNTLRDEIQREADEDRARFFKKYGFMPGSPEYCARFKP
jgi:GT2 family glycosyltransferase